MSMNKAAMEILGLLFLGMAAQQQGQQPVRRRKALPKGPRMLRQMDSVKPQDSEEYDLIIAQAVKHGFPVSPEAIEIKSSKIDEFPKLTIFDSHLVLSKVPDAHPDVRWLSRDEFLSGLRLTGEAIKEARDKGEELYEDTQRIVVPEGMSKVDAANELMRQAEEEDKVSEYTREFEGYYYKDVLVAIKKAIERTFGWIDGRDGFFGEKPKMIDVPLAIREDGSEVMTKAFYGKAAVAAWGSGSHVQTFASGPFNAGIKATARKKHEAMIQAFFDEIGRILKEESIFKGKAVTVTWQSSPFGEGVQMDLLGLKTNPNIVLNEGTQEVIDVLVQADLRADNKRIYLLTGPYGNGKTETCLKIASDAVKLGYTFMYVKSPEQLPHILLAAKKYLPVLVFMEDIDQIASGDRSIEINDILNTLDGTELKGSNIKVLFTTNHPEKLNVALRRPGRIDAVLQFANPDKKSVKEIVRRILGSEPGFDKLDLEQCAQEMPDVQGAFVAEICTRALKYSQTMGGLTQRIFSSSILGMKGHIDMMSVQEKSSEQVTVEALKRVGDVLRGEE